MKRKIALFLLGASLLAGCANSQASASEEVSSSVNSENSNSEVSNPFSKVLSALKAGYHLEALNTSTYSASESTSGNKTTYRGYEEIYGSDGKYRHTKYQSIVSGEPNKDVIDTDSLYVRQNSDIAERYLSVANMVESRIVAPKMWRFSYLQNAFASFRETDFKEENGSYVFQKDSNEDAAMYLGCQLRGYPRSSDSSVSSLRLTLNADGSVSFKAELEPYSFYYVTAMDVSSVYEGKFITMGQAVEDIKPVEKEEDLVFKGAMEKIAALNFDASGTNYEILAQDGRYEKTESVSASSWGDGFTYRFYDDANKIKEDAAYVLRSDKAQRIAIYEDRAYLSGLPIDAAISSLWSFSPLSSAFFNKESEGNYVLDSRYLGLFNSTSLFTPFVQDSIETLHVTISDDEVKFVSTNSGNGRTVFGAREEMTYSHFGSKEAISYDAKETSDDLTWADIIRDENDYLSASKMVGGKTILNEIPVFGGVYSEGGFVDQDGYQYFSARVTSEAEVNDLLSSYSKKLVTSGFSAKEMSDEGGTYYTYTKAIGEKSLTLLPQAGLIVNPITGAKSYLFALDAEVTNA